MSHAKTFRWAEVCRVCEVESEALQHFVEENWLRPVARAETLADWLFDEEDLSRVRLIQDLKILFGVNQEALPIILHLVDQLYYLHAQIQTNPRPQ